MIVRHQKILELLAVQESLRVKELSGQLNVTEATIRTDLIKLAELGKVVRTHGGAQLIEERIRHEYTFQKRKNLHSAIKQKIGNWAVNYISYLDSVIFDASTTVLALAHALKKREDLKDVTVITTGVWTAIELMGCQNINVLLPGGYLRPTTGSMMGNPTNDFLKDLIIQKAFLGAWGISVNNGLTDTNLQEIELKKSIVSRAKEVIVLADSSKFRQSGLAAYAEIGQISKIVTDFSAPHTEIEKIRQIGVEVITVS
jgi:DeoR/GlpR family transcriptional regulator of sugar metabolism